MHIKTYIDFNDYEEEQNDPIIDFNKITEIPVFLHIGKYCRWWFGVEGLYEPKTYNLKIKILNK